MKGLVKKDFLLLKGNLTYFIVVTIIFSVFSVMESSFDIASFLPFMGMILLVSTFSWDDYNNWNAYAITLPVGRKNIVKSKYISAIITIVLSAIISLIVSFITTSIAGNSFDFVNSLSYILGSILGLVLVLGIWFPCIYKFGVEKGRIILFVGVFATIIIASGLVKIFGLPSFSFDYSDKALFIILPLAIICIFTISYIVSAIIYSHKEF